ncbi:MAG: hypothetical protein A2W00_10965 [Candidatus Eisenbacteria bacterium RBG_16_71_46]|nr:MAG: hypothetical protein A2W00_10965 [Candidatus Eisenbacteria bacterium RBG_16_71_46]
MISVRRFAESDRERWDGYVARTPNSHFAHRTGWKRLVEESYGCRSHYWIAEDGGDVRGVLPLFEKRGPGSGRSLFSPPGGLLAEDEPTAQALLAPAVELLRRERWDLIELRDQRHRWPDLATVEEHVTMELALEPDAERQWQGFGAKLRNQIRKGQKSGVTARWGPEGLADFHHVLLENMRDLGTPILGPDYFQRALERLAPEAEILVVDVEGRPVGAMFLVAHGDTFSDPWASSLRRFFDRCPNQLLYWEAIRHAIARGFKRFDFGRSQPDSGTYRFKEQWGARPVRLYYQYVLGRAQAPPTLEAQKRSFDLAVRLWRLLPIPVAGVLGPLVRRLFPEAL